jgi:hypothetical protein
MQPKQKRRQENARQCSFFLVLCRHADKSFFVAPCSIEQVPVRRPVDQSALQFIRALMTFLVIRARIIAGKLPWVAKGR